MNREQRLARIREIVTELGVHLEVLEGRASDSLEVLSGERIDVHAEPAPGESFSIRYAAASDEVIASFMALVTPLSVPTEADAARLLFVQLAREAEYVGRREQGGHLWAIRIVDNGRYELWTDVQGTIERLGYRGL